MVLLSLHLQILDKAKRGYQEKKQLLLKHVQTEKTLSNQAKQLLDVATVATKDVDKLHETITRRKNYDQNNREACKNLDANLSANFDVISNNNSEFKSALNDQTSSLISKMSMEIDSHFLQQHFSMSNSPFFFFQPTIQNKAKNFSCQ